MRKTLVLICAVAFLATGAQAQIASYINGSKAQKVDPTHPLPAIDANNAAFGGAVAMTVGTSYAAARSVLANCTVAGNVSVTFPDTSTLVVPVNTGLTILPFAITAVNTSGTTATCTYANLK